MLFKWTFGSQIISTFCHVQAYLCYTYGAYIAPIRRRGMTTPYRPRQEGAQSLDGDATVYCVIRWRGNTAGLGTGVVVAYRVQDRDQSGDQKAHQHTHTEIWRSELTWNMLVEILSLESHS